jgi:aminopeptidase N
LAACETAQPPDTSPGVSSSLAAHRAATLSDIRYELSLAIPESLGERIRGREVIRFFLSDASSPLLIDFHESPSSLLSVRADGSDARFEYRNDHIILPSEILRVGENVVEIEFLAGDNALNRNKEFLYTLFVPDRARFTIPCFDQPNLKARFTLKLEVPAGWQAVGNSPVTSRAIDGARATYRFAETKPLSTYLFSFVTGEFQVVEGERDGRTMRMYHRETDTVSVERNSEAVFDLHASSLNWLEDYTHIPYPFDKFDFVLIPSLQYRGMEHPGAILYRASSLFLEEAATQSEKLRRASLIAHETAHMWFGDLVTMAWFDDVWTKEVYANFMAAKIVNPSFPDIDHELRFLLTHYPPAYEVDRTEGANPIRQQLDNLNEAGTLYGAIIYQKAPIVMQQLEGLVGADNFRDGLREYLDTFRYANATWPELIQILDARSAGDINAWSRVWVEEAGRPKVAATIEVDELGALSSLVLTQSDPAGQGREWHQELNVMLGYPHKTELLPVRLESRSQEVSGAKYLPAPDFILPNGRGSAYGLFELDDGSLEHLVQNAASLEVPLVRGIVWLTLWDAMLEGRVAPDRLVDLAVTSLAFETNELLVQRILNYLEEAYWRYLSSSRRADRAAELESLLWDLLEGVIKPSLKASYFDAYRSIALSDSAAARLESIWRQQTEISGLPLSERDYMRLAHELAIREVNDWEAILDEQQDRIENPDRRERFAFVRPALSNDPAERDAFFGKLERPEGREHEPWVLEAVGFLHHPRRAVDAEKYISPSLELLEEIQATGDIFFPKDWLDATLGGHNSESAASIVRRFLDDHPDYPARLRGKILQSADGLFRSARIVASQGL